MADLDLEIKDELQRVANDQRALLMSFIAPDSIVRTSPISIDYAQIRVQDLYNIEGKIEEVKTTLGNLPEKLHLIIQTPGGDLYISTKIARYLQKLFSRNITAFVPYEAASGGTLLCLTAKKIVMDATSNLTPIDPQVFYKNQRVSATSYEQAIKDFKESFGNFRPEEIASPHQQIGSQFDPIIAKEMSRIAWDTLNVAYKILLLSQNSRTKEQKDKLISIVFKLGNSDSPHSHVISAQEAEEFGLNIDASNESLTLLRLYKKWVSAKLKEVQATHIVEVFYPQSEPAQTGVTNETEEVSR